ncbi:MAG: HK97 family phage prohead protease, partial [bacterium]|nr:HK97 family phage prohead protease [bacterium]
MNKAEKRYFDTIEGFEKRQNDNKTYLRGYAVKYNQLSRPIGWGFREKFAPGAFDKVLEADARNVANDTVCLFQHNPLYVLGRRSSGTLQMGSDKTGLWYEVELPNTEAGKTVKELTERGDLRHSSFAFNIANKGEVWTEDETDGEVRTIEQVNYLKDVSPVTDPAYPQTEVAKRSYDTWKAETDNDNNKI